MKITKNYFKAKTLLLIGCLSFACQANTMGKGPEQWGFHLEKTFPRLKSRTRLFCFPNGQGNEFVISDSNRKVTFTENNKVLREISEYKILDRTPDSQFYLLQTIPPQPPEGKMEATFQDHIMVCNYRGEEIWNAPGIGAYGYSLSPNAQYAVYFVSPEYHPAYPPTFINKKGIMNKDVVEMKAANLEKWNIDYSKIVGWAFSKSGSYTAVALDVGSEKPSVVAIFDSNGYPKLFLEGKIIHGGNMYFSDDEKEIVATGLDQQHKRKIEVYDIDESKFLWDNTNAIHNLNVAWLGNNELVVPGFLKNDIRLINVTTKGVLWDRELNPCNDFELDSIRTYDSYFGILGSCKNPEQTWLMFINSTGKVILSRELVSYQQQYFGLAAIDVFDDQIVLYEKDKISLFQIDRK